MDARPGVPIFPTLLRFDQRTPRFPDRPTGAGPVHSYPFDVSTRLQTLR